MDKKKYIIGQDIYEVVINYSDDKDNITVNRYDGLISIYKEKIIGYLELKNDTYIITDEDVSTEIEYLESRVFFDNLDDAKNYAIDHLLNDWLIVNDE